MPTEPNYRILTLTQASYLIFPGTSGAPYMDYLLADRHVSVSCVVETNVVCGRAESDAERARRLTDLEILPTWYSVYLCRTSRVTALSSCLKAVLHSRNPLWYPWQQCRLPSFRTQGNAEDDVKLAVCSKLPPRLDQECTRNERNLQVIPPEHVSHYSESLVLLPRTYQTNFYEDRTWTTPSDGVTAVDSAARINDTERRALR